MWNDGALEDVTEAVAENISAMYRENPPELVYYVALYRIFHEFLEETSPDSLPKEGSGLYNSKIWGMLYDFQRDAVTAIVNKLQTYNGCILADSVGLGKTFTALAVIKYYESLNRNVLVLCPKKLTDNWTTYRNNQSNNPIAEDRLRYDVLYHTDLSRKRGKTATGIDLETFNWGTYDLVVIDESHNFRNGEDTPSATREGEEGSENRYQRLLNRIVQGGIPTKVLMLTATPVNNRFRDLRNQLALVYQGDPNGWSERVGLSVNVEEVFRNAQKAFNAWSKLPAEERTTEALTDELDFDFFQVLDKVTVARSRKHIQRYYDVNAIGPFPERNKPISIRPKLSTFSDGATYSEIAESLDLLVWRCTCRPNMCFRAPHSNMPTRTATLRRAVASRVCGALWRTPKRLESSVSSFRMTLERVLAVMNACLGSIEAYKAGGARGQNVDVADYCSDWDFDADDAEDMEFMVGGGKSRFDLRDMDWKSWERDVSTDVQVIEDILGMVRPIDATHDAKLLDLERLIEEKVEHPLNPGNKKVIVFTAFCRYGGLPVRASVAFR